jgi:uncharacterized protein YkwD
MSVKAWIMAAALGLAALPPDAHADLREAVNWAREVGCGRAVRVALRDNAPLRRAADEMASGRSLHEALTAAGYLAAESSAVHLSGALSDGQVSGVLSSRECAALTNPSAVDMGVVRRGRDVWIVLAGPVSLPSVRDGDRVRLQILDLVNQARRSGQRCGGKSFPPAAPLVENPLLNDAAYAHSREMAGYDEFDHRGHDGSSPSARVMRAGYGSFSIVGENIAAGPMTPAEVTQGWLGSPAHCENIMDPRFSEMGVAFAVNPASSELIYWTQDFAAPGRAHLAAGAP